MRLLSIIFVLYFFYACTEKTSEKSHQVNANPTLFSVSQLNTGNDKTFKHHQNFTPEFKIYEPLGSGVAVLDVDNDGNYEVFFAQFDKDNHNNSASILYKIENDIYRDITKQAGLSHLTSIMGAATADINNDGWTDIIIYGFKQLHLMINHRGQFKELNLNLPIKDSFYSSATFFNANNDEYLDLWLARYVTIDDKKPVQCHGKDDLPIFCAPSALPFQSDRLLINNGGKSFIPATKDVIEIPASPALGVVAADFNNDQLQDVYVANDGQDNYLFTQQKNGHFIEQAQEKSVSSNLAGLKEASMGIAVGDYDNNGQIDLFLTHLEQESNTLYENELNWFSDVTNRVGLATNSRIHTGFGTGFYDLNGDNWLDLFITNGNIQPKPYQPRNDLTEQFSEKPLLYLNQMGTFKNMENFVDNKITSVGRGLAFIDIDNDGDKDVISNNNNQSPILFTNNLNPTQWYGLSIKCHNRTDIGAQIKFTVQSPSVKQTFYRNIHTDGSYASANDPRSIIYLKEDENITSIHLKYTNQLTKQITSAIQKNKYTVLACTDK